MIKKISICFSMFVGFLFCLLFSENINILAYKSSTIDNVFGSYPIQMDIDNYKSVNIFNNATISDGYEICGFSVCTNSTWFISDFIPVEYNSTYTKNLSNGNDYLIFDSNFNQLNNSIISFTNNSITINNVDVKYIKINNLISNLNSLILVEGNNIPENYDSPLIFGYRVDLCANSTSSFSANVTFSASNSNYNFSRNGYFNVSANSTSCVSDIVGQNVVPFNVNENGLISLENTTFNVSFTNTSGTLSNGYYLQFTPILNGYYKGQYTTNLYSINRYTYNNLVINGVNLESDNPGIGYITTNNPNTFNYGVNELTVPINVIYYNNVSQVKQNNVISINEYINRGFIIGLNSSNISTLNSSELIFTFSGLSTYISGQLATNSPLPENELTISKYNNCSAWYDIPCQLGNAITYVVYEAPIISPVLTFIVSFVTMFSSLVSFVDVFKSFGIVFGCFIIYMFIELLHKYSK